MDSVGIRVAGRVQPVATSMLSPVHTGQILIDQLLISVRRLVLNESVDVRRLRWQSGQIERQSSSKRAAIGLRSRREPSHKQAIQNEVVDGTANPILVEGRRLGDRRSRWRNVRPMLLILCAFG